MAFLCLILPESLFVRSFHLTFEFYWRPERVRVLRWTTGGRHSVLGRVHPSGLLSAIPLANADEVTTPELRKGALATAVSAAFWIRGAPLQPLPSGSANRVRLLQVSGPAPDRRLQIHEVMSGVLDRLSHLPIAGQASPRRIESAHLAAEVRVGTPSLA